MVLHTSPMSNPPPVRLKDYMARGVAAVWEAEARQVSQEGPQPPAPKGRTTKPRRGRLNKTEARYAERLEGQRLTGDIAWWGFEAIRFRLADNTFFTPDFLVMLPDGQLTLHETKGFMREAASLRLRITSEAYWMFPVFVVRWEKGAFTVQPLDGPHPRY